MAKNKLLGLSHKVFRMIAIFENSRHGSILMEYFMVIFAVTVKVIMCMPQKLAETHVLQVSTPTSFAGL